MVPSQWQERTYGTAVRMAQRWLTPQHSTLTLAVAKLMNNGGRVPTAIAGTRREFLAVYIR